MFRGAATESFGGWGKNVVLILNRPEPVRDRRLVSRSSGASPDQSPEVGKGGKRGMDSDMQ